MKKLLIILAVAGLVYTGLVVAQTFTTQGLSINVQNISLERTGLVDLDAQGITNADLSFIYSVSPQVTTLGDGFRISVPSVNVATTVDTNGVVLIDLSLNVVPGSVPVTE